MGQLSRTSSCGRYLLCPGTATTQIHWLFQNQRIPLLYRTQVPWRAFLSFGLDSTFGYFFSPGSGTLQERNCFQITELLPNNCIYTICKCALAKYWRTTQVHWWLLKHQKWWKPGADSAVYRNLVHSYELPTCTSVTELWVSLTKLRLYFNTLLAQ